MPNQCLIHISSDVTHGLFQNHPQLHLLNYRLCHYFRATFNHTLHNLIGDLCIIHRMLLHCFHRQVQASTRDMVHVIQQRRPVLNVPSCTFHQPSVDMQTQYLQRRHSRISTLSVPGETAHAKASGITSRNLVCSAIQTGHVISVICSGRISTIRTDCGGSIAHVVATNGNVF